MRAALSILLQFFAFIKNERKWWLVPVVVILALLSLFVMAAQNPWLAPFVYPLF